MGNKKNHKKQKKIAKKILNKSSKKISLITKGYVLSSIKVLKLLSIIGVNSNHHTEKINSGLIAYYEDLVAV